MTHAGPPSLGRRPYLAALGGLGASALAGCSLLEPEADGATTTLDGEAARALAERFAPTLYFDAHERWFPTDPRPYTATRDGETVVDGFDALNGYHERTAATGAPPDPTVFYHVVAYDDSPLAVVQFWQYSAFDQFTTNFHWHDWEVLHVFVDTETGAPQLYVASSHARSVPNNEFVDPDPDRIPAVLVELGSHSNALSLNETRDRFQRLPGDGVVADITNGALDGLEAIADVPLAYGLPRDEGGRLPFVVPELDGAPLYEHDRLPAIDRSSLLDDALIVRSFAALASPPGALPLRETGDRFEHAGRAAPDADVEYDLAPTRDLEAITAFTGPQLSFEFTVPAAVEDTLAGHLTTTGVPWQGPRYDNPAADISDPTHRAILADRYDAIGPPASAGTVVARITEAVPDPQAPAAEGLTTVASTVEAVAMLESDPQAVPTFGGVAVLRGVDAGEHRLTVNGAGLAPHSETIAVRADGDPAAAGVAGRIPLVANEHAVKLELDPATSPDPLTAMAVADDFAGRLYEAPVDGPDAVYLHRGGAYTTELRDADDAVGAVRVTPDATGTVRLDRPRTGKAALASFLAAIAEETAATVADATARSDSTDGENGPGEGDDSGDGNGSSDGSANAIVGLSRALRAVAASARRAAERAEAGDRGNADAALETVAARLDRATERLQAAQAGLPPAVVRASDRRLEQGRRRNEQARASAKL